jgi:hypothetical protein
MAPTEVFSRGESIARAMKMLPLPLFRKMNGCIKAEINRIFAENRLPGVFIGWESIARIFKTWKHFSDTDLNNFCYETFYGVYPTYE